MYGKEKRSLCGGVCLFFDFYVPNTELQQKIDDNIARAADRPGNSLQFFYSIFLNSHRENLVPFIPTREVFFGKRSAKKVTVELNIEGVDITVILKDRAFYALKEIRNIVLLDLDDFQTVEEILKIFGKYGIDTGVNHDF